MDEQTQITLRDYLSGLLSTQVACERLGVCRTTLWRKAKRFQEEGPAGLVHKLAGKPSNNARPNALKEEIRSLWNQCAGSSILGFYRSTVKTLDASVSYSAVRRWIKK